MKREYTKISSLECNGYKMTLERVEGVEGPDQSLVTPGAERPKEQDGGEDLRDRSRVTPLARREALDYALEIMAKWQAENARSWLSFKNLGNNEQVRFYYAAQVEDGKHMEVLETLLTETPSDAPHQQEPPQSEASTEAEA